MEASRGILSCALCRQRKLKCDRQVPCGNCTIRKLECTYGSAPARGRDSSQKRVAHHQLDARIKRLEQLISTIANQKPQGDSAALPGADPGHGSDAGLSHDSGSASPPPPPGSIEPGRILTCKGQTAYVSPTHWASICEEVVDLRNSFDRASLSDPADRPPVLHHTGPMLLEWPRLTSDMQEVLADVPPRDAADRLVARFFNFTGLSLVVLHGPTFEDMYQLFWHDPGQVSTTWISLLFSIMVTGGLLYLRSGDVLPEGIENSMQALERLQRRSAECLVLAKYYTQPTQYTIEAIMINLQNEFLKQADAHLGIWAMSSVGIRLAIHMGYHRDPDEFSQISAFEGEMRRRVWANMKQIDTLTSFQLGMPSMIQESQCDTRPPRNLLDEDFGPDSAELPPSRPETELTPQLYVICKGRLSLVFEAIYAWVLKGRFDDYDEIMELDKRLRSAHQSISPRFRMASLRESVTVTPYLLIRRYALELMYQKSLCILHRHHMTKSYQNPKYNFSRSAGVEAALVVLEHHANIIGEVRVGGLLHRHKWLHTSLEMADFLQAVMIVCLELHCRVLEPAKQHSESNAPDSGFMKFSQDDLVKALRGAQERLAELKSGSSECHRAFVVLSAKLKVYSSRLAALQGQQAASSGAGVRETTADGYSEFDEMDTLGGTTDSEDWRLHVDPPPASHPEFTSPAIDGIGSFFESPNMADWGLWDTFIKGGRGAE